MLQSLTVTIIILEKFSVYSSNVLALLQSMQSESDGNSDESDRGVLSRYIPLLEEIVQCFHSIVQEWDKYLDDLHSNSSSYSVVAVSVPHRQGRPKFCISKEQLEYLSSMSFTCKQIASMLGVSRMTIYRRRMEYGVTEAGANISDDDLKAIVRSVSSEQPAIGETMLWGRIKSMGFRVTRSRLRFAIAQVDPLRRALRWSNQLSRRQPYSVAGPNSLWHMGKLM